MDRHSETESSPSRPSSWIVFVIVAVNAAIYMLMGLQSDSFMQLDLPLLIQYGGRNGSLVSQGDWWRLFTAVFLHAGLAHLAINLLGLYILGRYIEPALGWYRFLSLYLISGLAGNILSQIIQIPTLTSVGASGSIFGLAGAILAYHLLAAGSFLKMLRHPVGLNIALIIAFNLILGFSIPTVDNGAHVGGLVAGAILGYWYLGRAFSKHLVASEAIRTRILQIRVALISLLIGGLLTGSILIMLNISFPQKITLQKELQVVLYQMKSGQYMEAENRLLQWREFLRELSQDQEDTVAAGTELGVTALLAESQMEQGQHEQAAETLTPFLEMPAPSGSFTFHRMAARMLAYLGETASAEKALRQILKADSDNRQALQQLLDLYLYPPTADRRRAQEILGEIQQVVDNPAWITFLRGRIQFTFLDYEESLKTLLSVKPEQSGDPEWHFYTGLSYSRLDEYEDAVPFLLEAHNRLLARQMSEDSRNMPDLHRMQVDRSLLEALEQTGRIEKARRLRNAYIDTLQTEVDQLGFFIDKNDLAYFLALQEHKLENAKDLAQRAVETHANSATLDTLAWVLYGLAEYEQALENQRRALAKAPQPTPELLFHLGAILEKAGQTEEAIQTFEKALDFGVDYAERPETLNRLHALQGLAPTSRVSTASSAPQTAAP